MKTGPFRRRKTKVMSMTLLLEAQEPAASNGSANHRDAKKSIFKRPNINKVYPSGSSSAEVRNGTEGLGANSQEASPHTSRSSLANGHTHVHFAQNENTRKENGPISKFAKWKRRLSWTPAEIRASSADRSSPSPIYPFDTTAHQIQNEARTNPQVSVFVTKSSQNGGSDLGSRRFSGSSRGSLPDIRDTNIFSRRSTIHIPGTSQPKIEDHPSLERPSRLRMKRKSIFSLLQSKEESTDAENVPDDSAASLPEMEYREEKEDDYNRYLEPNKFAQVITVMAVLTVLGLLITLIVRICTSGWDAHIPSNSTYNGSVT